jgi:hypothetical protein
MCRASGPTKRRKVICRLSSNPHPLDLEGAEDCQDASYVDKYGICLTCGYRAGVACTCGMTFAEKAKTVGIDAQALRILHGD